MNSPIAKEVAVFDQKEDVSKPVTTPPLHALPGKREVTRRDLMIGGVAAAALISLPVVARSLEPRPASSFGTRAGSNGNLVNTITVKDGTRIYFKDWGAGQPVVFSHGWPLNADAWDAQMLFLAQRGYRVVAHDRRGHGRSGQSRGGNDLNTYADDLAQLFDALKIEDAMLIGHSTGGGEVVRYIGRHGDRRLSKLVLIGAITPALLKSDKNPNGIPVSVFNDVRTAVTEDRSQFLKDLSLPFFGYNKPGAKVSHGVQDEFWRQGMQASIDATYDCIKAQSETDMTEDLQKINVPTLVLHGEQDQLVPIADTAMLTAKIVRRATLKVYPGAPHGLTVTLAEQVNEDLLSFLKA
jgi:non-heme chloroperoxidase